MNEPHYVEPHFTIHDSFDNLSGHDELSAFSFDKKDSEFKFEDFFQSKRAFILAEPGYGKSRVIQEITDRAEENNKRAVSIAFNQLEECALTALEGKIRASQEGSANHSTGFDLSNDTDVILCLDALDEVDSAQFSDALNLIADVAEKYPTISIYASCRTHYFADKRYNFNRFTGFQFIKVTPLNSQQIRDFLDSEFSQIPNRESVISDIVERSYGYSGMSVFSIPRYLLAFVEARVVCSY